MNLYTVDTDIPIGYQPRETEGSLRRPLIHLVGGHRARRPWLLSMGEKLGHVGFNF